MNNVNDAPLPQYPQKFERISEAEIQYFRNCTRNSVILSGLPFAVFMDIFYRVKEKGNVDQAQQNPAAQRALKLKRGFSFMTNIALGTLLYVPVCYSKFSALVHENYRKRLANQEQTQFDPVIEEHTANPVPGDIGFSTYSDDAPNFSEPDATFNVDSETSKPPLVGKNINQPVPTTSYEELRKRNRSAGYSNIRRDNLPTSKNYSEQPNQSDEPNTQRVRRNQYGDEIE